MLLYLPPFSKAIECFIWGNFIHVMFRHCLLKGSLSAQLTIMGKLFFSFLCFLLLSVHAFGQSALPVDSTEHQGTAAVIALYQTALKQESGLYNGREHIRYSPSYIGHAYFAENSWQSSSVLYDGMFYDKVPAQYDLVKDDLVILHYNGAGNIRLVKEKVAQFELAGHTFINMHPDSARAYKIEAGFYDLLFSGVIDVLAKRKKMIQERMVMQQLEIKFEPKETYYIKKEGTYYPVKNAAALLNVLQDKKREVQQHLRKNNLKFRKDPEATLVQAAEYYNDLKN